MGSLKNITYLKIISIINGGFFIRTVSWKKSQKLISRREVY